MFEPGDPASPSASAGADPARPVRSGSAPPWSARWRSPLGRALTLTRLGMIAERLTRAFWPLVTLAMAVLAALMFGLQDLAPLELFWAAAVAAVLGAVLALLRGLWRYRTPGRAEAAARLDATLPGRPLQALADRQAVGAGDAASEAVWQAHQARMAERAKAARPARPDLRLAARDPYALRYVALVALVMALLFGSLWRVAGVGGLLPGGAGPAAAVASWEGWIEPPAYTARPTLYLADQPEGALAVPIGSLVTLRLYGEVGRLIVDETVSGRTGLVGSASDPVQSFAVTRDGRLSIRGPGGREWQIQALPDAPPQIALDGPPQRSPKGEMRLAFTASDDFGVTAARASIALDLDRVDRRYGLAAAPEPREAITFDLPLRPGGDRRALTQVALEDFAQHPWAGLPVTITLTAVDAAGQEASSAPVAAILPGRRFFDTLAMALVENRRDLLWSAANAARTAQVLRAISWRPEDGFSQPGTYLKLRAVIRGLESGLAEAARGAAEGGGLAPGLRDEAAAALWTLAVELEEGTLENALERMRDAQRRLSEAIRNGATPEEIARLMDELRAATDAYIQMLAEAAPDGTDTPDPGGSGGPSVSGDQIAEMMRQLQELMEQGRSAEAQALLQQLQQLLENLQVTRAPGQGGPGEEAMRSLGETLRGQQELSDDTFGDLNGRPPAQRGEQGAEGGQPQPGDGRPGDGQQDGAEPGQPAQPDGAGREGGPDRGAGSLAERQRALRDLLQGQRSTLPGAGTAEGDAAREALDRAGRAMEQAEEALRQGDGSGALDSQAEAMEALREGVRQLGRMGERRAQAEGEGEGEQFGDNSGRAGGRDPLGRLPSGDGRLGSAQDLPDGLDLTRRARELLDELRRRSGQAERPREELDYLKRLLEFF